jgi:hypothetical protein
MGGGFHFTRADVEDMTYAERQAHIKWLAAQREFEKQALEEARKK